MHNPSTHLLTVFLSRGRKKAHIPVVFRQEVPYTLAKPPVYHTSNDEQPFRLTFTPEDNACLWTVGESLSQEKTRTDARRTCKLPREMHFQAVLLMHITAIGQLHGET